MAKKVTMLTKVEFELDGDLMAVIENLYQEVVVKNELKHTYQDMKAEIDNIVSQMGDEELRTYFTESLFMNIVAYENQMLEALMRKLTSDEDE